MVMVNDLGKAIHLLVWTTTTMEINLKPGLFDRKIRFVLTFTFMLLFDRWWQTVNSYIHQIRSKGFRCSAV